MSIPPDYTLSKEQNDRVLHAKQRISSTSGRLTVEMSANGFTDEQAINSIVHTLVYIAAAFAINMALAQGREPDFERWSLATTDIARKVLEDMQRTRPEPQQ